MVTILFTFWVTLLVTRLVTFLVTRSWPSHILSLLHGCALRWVCAAGLQLNVEVLCRHNLCRVYRVMHALHHLHAS